MTKFEMALLERLDGIKEELAYHRKKDQLWQAKKEEYKAFAASEEGQRQIREEGEKLEKSGAESLRNFLCAK